MRSQKLIHLNFYAFFCILLILTQNTNADDTNNNNATTAQSSTESSTTTTTTTIATTLKPKVNVSASDICKKCSCDVASQMLDCSRGRMAGSWFSDDEWGTLQNGDVIFKIIKLDHNNLTAIPEIPAYPVEDLYLSNNNISTIAISAFGNLTQLTKLDLSHNELDSKDLQADIFRGQYLPPEYYPLENMNELNLGANNLHTLPSNFFEHLPHLETLILCENTFQHVDHSTEVAIANVVDLKTLDMSYMELKELTDTFLHGPRDLEVLILSGNLFEQLPKTLEQAVSLKNLVLDENLFTNFSDNNVFPEMRNLEYLSISYMQDLTKIGQGAFSQLKKLKVLNAANNNKLEEIAVDAFSSSTSNPEILDYPPIEKLYLHNDNLTVLDAKLLQRWDKVEIIDLRYNPWVCDSDNNWLINVLIKQISSTKSNLTQNVECAAPEKFKGVSILKLNSEGGIDAGSNTGVIFISLIFAFLVIVPLVIASVCLYKRGYFRSCHRGSSATAQYSRADFADDMYI